VRWAISGIWALPDTVIPSSQIQQLQNLFNIIDAQGNGSITQTQLEQAVTADGGTTQGADALYATLDPNHTGNVTETQFLQNLRGPLFSL